MKKFTKIAAIVVAVLVLVSPAGFAATQSTAPVNISAQVLGALSISVVLHQNSSIGALVTSMDFGSLQGTSGTLRSSSAGSTGTGSVVAMITCNSSGLPYAVTETSAAALTSGINTIPTGACAVVPVYAAADNGGDGLVGSLGTAGSWVGTRTLYTSDGIGSIRTIQSHFAIVDSGSTGGSADVPLNQPAGTYTGTVTFTVTA